MSKLSEFLQKQAGPTEKKPEGIPLDVSVVCQRCFVQCDEAEYFPEDGILTWVCPEGHRSYAEDFRL